jgi:outer membrane protein, heavy metal efflux system
VGQVLRARASLADSRASLAALTGDPNASAEGDPLTAAPPPGGAGERDDVRAAEAAVEASRAALARERAATIPAIDIGVFYENDAGRAVIGPTLGLEVPLWQRNPAGRGSARGDLLVAEAEVTSTSARATAERTASEERMRDLAPLAALLGDDPAGDATAVLTGIEVAWRAGELDIAAATLLRARALEGRRAWVQARAEVAEARIAGALAEGMDTLIP